MQQVLTLPPGAECADRGDEEELITSARTDPAAFGILYERYLGRIYAYLRTRTSSEEDAADLTQQVFLKALSALPQYRTRQGPFKGWLFGIARNAAVDCHRRQRSTVTWDLLPAALQPLAGDDVEAETLGRESLLRLRTLFAALDAERREVLVLRFVAGLTTAEIAAAIGKSEAATKKYLTRTLHSLKEQYREHA